MSKVLFTSDLHIGHRKIIEYTNRGADTTQEDHDDWVVDLWNSQVDKNTIVYSLGDFVFNCRKLDKFKSVTDRLNGQKILIRGNHCSREVYQKSGFQWYDLKAPEISYKMVQKPRRNLDFEPSYGRNTVNFYSEQIRKIEHNSV